MNALIESEKIILDQMQNSRIIISDFYGSYDVLPFSLHLISIGLLRSVRFCLIEQTLH